MPRAMCAALRRWWPLVVLALATIAGVVWYSRRSSSRLAPLPDLSREFRAIQAEAHAARAAATLSAERALVEVQTRHAEELAALDEAQLAEAELLRADPEKLAGFLIRAAHDKRSGST